MAAARVQRWGNSQGLRLPKHVLERAGLKVGDSLAIEICDQEIVLRKIAKPKYDLAELAARIPEESKPKEEGAGPPVGREEW